MKRNNLILGIAALVFAVGSAFATVAQQDLKIFEDIYDDDQGVICADVPDDICDGGLGLCVVTVFDESDQANKDVTVRLSSNCPSSTLQSSTKADLSSTISIE